MKLTDESFLIIILLTVQVILIFFRTGLYIIFDNHFLNIDYYFKKPNKKEIDYVLTLFAVIRLIISSSILYLRKLHNDLLTYVLLYLVLSSFIRFYYQYLTNYYPKSKAKYWVDKYQDVNSFILFLISGYILKKIFYY